MTISTPISDADFFTLEEREEMRFLTEVKGALREAAADIQESEQLTQEQLAQRSGYDAGQFSKILNADRHNSTSSLFRVMFRLGRRWTFGSVPLPEKAQNRPAQAELARPPQAFSKHSLFLKVNFVELIRP
jgi:transcriptional regulator with XRE-family HTH domain